MSIIHLSAQDPFETRAPVFKTEDFYDRLRARDFVWEYIPTFCVYCPLTQNLYTDYELFNVDRDQNVVVLPKGDFLSTFPAVQPEAISQSPLMLVPNRRISKAYVCQPGGAAKSRNASEALLQLATQKGFLPVVLKSDLKRLKSDLPFLMLRQVRLSALKTMSVFSQGQLRNAIIEKLDQSSSRWTG